ncbi:MAG: response regulator transcription factor [Leptolyngbya sp. IPPAS B-1204]|jgi:DNA-binding CsgD family transcriptional regulator
MALLTSADFRSILKFLQELHISYNLETFSAQIVSLLPQVVPSELISCHSINFMKRKFSYLASSHPVEEEQLGIAQISHKHFHEHPLLRHYLQTGNSNACKISDLLSENQLHRLEGLYQNAMRLLGLEDQMSIVLNSFPPETVKDELLTYGKEIFNIAILRSQRDFSERDRLVLNLLRPHLLQTYQNAQILTQMQQEQTQLNRTIEQLNLITLTGDGNVRLMTPQAWMLLQQYFQASPHYGSRLPENLQRWVHYQLSLLTQTDNIPSPTLPLQIEQDGKRLTIRFVVDRSQQQYLLMLEEQPARSFSVESLELLGLTRREAEVLFWVARDKSNEAIATILECSDKTVKKHLEHIYAKFEVQTRSGAVIFALEKLGILNS